MMLLGCVGMPAYAASMKVATGVVDLTVNISLTEKDRYAGVELSIVLSSGLTYVSHEVDSKFNGLYHYNGTRHLIGGMTLSGENEYSGTLNVCVLKLQYKGNGNEKITVVPTVSRYGSNGLPTATKKEEQIIEISRASSGSAGSETSVEVVIDGTKPDAASGASVTFTDIKGHWASGYIQSLAAQQYISGVGKEKFDPNGKLTRAALVQMLYNVFGGGEKSERTLAFADTTAGAWYHDAIAWAVDNGVVTGYNAHKFGPNDPISRQDITVIMARLAAGFKIELAGSDEAQNAKAFADDRSISQYAKNAVYQLYASAIISGKGNNKFDPLGYATRAEAAKILYLMLDKAGKIDAAYKVE